MNHYGIWIPAGLDQGGAIVQGGWMRFATGNLFWTTSIAVARAQREATAGVANQEGEVREFDKLGGPGATIPEEPALEGEPNG